MKQEMFKTVMVVETLTADQIRQENREYNASAWDQRIDSLLKYKDVSFYVARKQSSFDYDRYFAVYEIPEGIKLFNEVSYSTGISNNGFCRISIDNKGIVTRVLLKDKLGNVGRCANDKPNRKIMASNTKNFGTIYSNNH